MRISSICLGLFIVVTSLLVLGFEVEMKEDWSSERFVLSSNESLTYNVWLKRGWNYWFEVEEWSGEENISIHLAFGEKVILSEVLRGETLEYSKIGSKIFNPKVGAVIPVNETMNCSLKIDVLTPPLKRSTQLLFQGEDPLLFGFIIKGPITAWGFILALISLCIVTPIFIFNYLYFHHLKSQNKFQMIERIKKKPKIDSKVEYLLPPQLSGHSKQNSDVHRYLEEFDEFLSNLPTWQKILLVVSFFFGLMFLVIPFILFGIIGL